MAKSESMAKSCSNKCIHSGICFDKGVVNALTKWIAAMLGMLHSQLKSLSFCYIVCLLLIIVCWMTLVFAVFIKLIIKGIITIWTQFLTIYSTEHAGSNWNQNIVQFQPMKSEYHWFQPI